MITNRRAAVASTLAGSSFNLLLISVQAVLLIPLYMHYIGPRLYGAWLASGEILLWLHAFDLGLPSLLLQRIGAAHGRRAVTEVGEWFFSGLVVLGAAALVVLGAGWGIAVILPGFFDLPPEEAVLLRDCFLVGAAATALMIASNAVVGLARGVQKTGFFAVMTVLGSLASLLVALGLILAGAGLWAVALGLAARALVIGLASIVFVFRGIDAATRAAFAVRRPIVRELAAVSPLTAAGGLSYALMTQSEITLIAVLVSPALAAAYAMTRKAADLGRALLDGVGVATYGSFAHLVASEDAHRALRVHTQIRRLRLVVAVGLAAAYIAVNASLVAVWIGPEHYSGFAMTQVFALQLVVLGDAYLLNYLYRATGPVLRGSAASVVEAAARIPLMIGMVMAFGAIGAPIATVITALAATAIVLRWTHARLRQATERAPESPPASVALLWIAAVAAASYVGFHVRDGGWLFVVGVGTLIAGSTIVAGVALDPTLREAPWAIWQTFRRLSRGVWSSSA